MAEQYLPDSTDWLSTPLSALAAVENALRCQVCKDFFKTPMITSCSHTFCSLCIRRVLSSDGKCPLCRATEQENKLRSNWSLEEAVQAFISARSATLELARGDKLQPSAPKRKTAEEHHDTDGAPNGKRLRSSARLQKTQPAAPMTEQTEDDGTIEVPDSDDDGEYQPELDDGLVACPVCQDRMKEWQVFKHLETCTGPKTKPHRTHASSSSSIYSQQRQPGTAPERLPTINYSMYKEQALRKKMADLGISNQGPRALLERRHKEWMTIWNSNCDAARPRKRHELLHDLDVWEKTQGGRAPTTGRAVQNAAIIKDKDFDAAAWAAKHDTSFKDLIANARKTRLDAKRKAEEAAKETEKEQNANTLPQVQGSEAFEQQHSSQDGRALLPSTTSPSEGQEVSQKVSGLVVPNMAGPRGTTHQASSQLDQGISYSDERLEEPSRSQPAISDRSNMDRQPMYMHTDGNLHDTTINHS
ncbi:uncharacterized protein FIESC28_05484 [Fusarium coffeatum]|uniref:Postreplication repair E3 ubiquitin-protein ligase RAD18 n=1 Tax=Fusarium coffeatum TaxID=231269 RepID=A0A366RRH5_9HYPO|nr:uncharacterized protein FIESC28_05484 [Fusarium coffeatum]RBR19707.1 hypothetical protein FIESC28_05484 [Fusarium coffeatum]